MTKRPRWMSDNSDGKDSFWCDDPDFTILLARYACLAAFRFGAASSFPFKTAPREEEFEERAEMIALGAHVGDASTLEEWLSYVESYPKSTLTDRESDGVDREAVDIRAFMLRQVVSKLLSLAGAPQELASDFRHFFDTSIPKGAPARARVQKAILEDPLASLNDVAKRSKSSAGQVSKWGDAGMLFWPADPVGSGSSGSK